MAKVEEKIKLKRCIVCKKKFKARKCAFNKTCGLKCRKKRHNKVVVGWKEKNQERVKKNSINWRGNNKEKTRESAKLYYKKNTKKMQKNSIEWFKKHPEERKKMQKKASLKKLYNLDLKDYDTILKKQKNRCALCKTHVSKFSKKFSVDHNHKNKQIRGLLCTNCNTGIGKFKDNINLLRKAISYLKRDKRI